MQIIDIKFEYEAGCSYSSLDADGARLTTGLYDDELTTMGTLLTELFKIADLEDRLGLPT